MGHHDDGVLVDRLHDDDHWCSATNPPAAGGCADAMSFAATFAASGTKIN